MGQEVSNISDRRQVLYHVALVNVRGRLVFNFQELWEKLGEFDFGPDEDLRDVQYRIMHILKNGSQYTG